MAALLVCAAKVAQLLVGDGYKLQTRISWELRNKMLNPGQFRSQPIFLPGAAERSLNIGTDQYRSPKYAGYDCFVPGNNAQIVSLCPAV